MSSCVNSLANGPLSHVSVGCTSGTGIIGVISSVSRHYDNVPGKRPYRILKTSLYGRSFASSEEHSAECLRLGFTREYSRNRCEFVMSRAARKRGMKTSDYRYNAAAARAGK